MTDHITKKFKIKKESRTQFLDMFHPYFLLDVFKGYTNFFFFFCHYKDITILSFYLLSQENKVTKVFIPQDKRDDSMPSFLVHPLKRKVEIKSIDQDSGQTPSRRL